MTEFARFDGPDWGAGTVCWSAYVSNEGVETRTTNGGLGGDVHNLEHLGFEPDDKPTQEEIIDSWIQWSQEDGIDDTTDIYLVDEKSGFHLIENPYV